MAQSEVESSEQKDDDSFEIPDPDDDDIQLSDMTNLYLFREWWMAGQQPIGLNDLLNMPSGLWDDFKQLLAKYSQFKRIIKSQQNFDKREDVIRHA